MKFTFFFIFFFLFFNIEGNSAKAENIKLQGCYNETRTSYDKSGKIKETYGVRNLWAPRKRNLWGGTLSGDHKKSLNLQSGALKRNT